VQRHTEFGETPWTILQAAHDQGCPPGFPAEFRPFCLAHAAGLEVLRTEGGALDWVYVSPAGDFDHEGERTGRYGVRAHGDAAARISYADFALVLLDEAQTPRHHRSHLAVS